MQWFVENYASGIPGNSIRVLDAGSYDVNGSYRGLFTSSKFQYTGLDVESGPNVDIVLKNPYNWEIVPSDSFDVVISGQMLEHAEFFWITVQEMVRVLKKNGLLCIIAPNGAVEHRYPVDCYRFYTDGMAALAHFTGLDILHAHTNCAPVKNKQAWYSDRQPDSMLIARKPYDGPARIPDLKTYQCLPENHENLRNNLLPYAGPGFIKKILRKISGI